MAEPSGGSGTADAERPFRRVGVDGRTEEYRPDALTPAQAAVAIAWEPVEWLYVYDGGDRQVARFRGTSDAVDLSDELKTRTGALGLYGESVLKDHLIVHNHPTRAGADAVASYPPSRADLHVVVERDLRALVIASGGIQYEIRRPGSSWPFDETLLEATIIDLSAVLDETEGELDETPFGRVERQRRVLELLHELGVIDYERQAATGSV